MSRLIERIAVSGGFIVARAGKPTAKVVPLSAPGPGEARRLGLMTGQIRVPADFARMGEQEIETLFGGKS